MKIISAKINNILSIEDAYVEFDDNGLVLVQGWNHDVGRANGAGKTAIFNAITFALYDKLPRKITATEILRRGCKTGSVELLVEVHGVRYGVRRSRPKGVVFFESGGVAKPLVLTQEEWESKLGLNYTQFIISMYCAQGTTNRFLSLNDADKKQFLLQLLNLEEFSLCKAVADKKVKALDEQLQQVTSSIQNHQSKIDAYSESLIDEEDTKTLIEDRSSKISSFNLEMVELKTVQKPDLSKYQTLEDDIHMKNTEFTRTRTRREMLHDQYRRTNSQIRPFNESDSCRSCGARLDTSAAKAAHEHNVEERLHEVRKLKEEIDACDAVLVKEDRVVELSKKLKDKKKEESRSYELANRRALEIQSLINNLQLEVKNLTLKLQNNSELQSKINNLQVKCQEFAKNRDGLLNEIELYKTVSAVYSPMGAQAYVLDSVIDSLNSKVDEYVNLLWSDVAYEITSYKENVKGDVTAKFSEHLTVSGKDVSTGSLSGGEYRALSLCIDFALVDVLEKQFGINMSPIVLDEPFDGLDSAGRELVIELLGVLAEDRQIVVVDHTSEVKSMFSKTIMVDKKQGISSVSLQT